MANGLYDSAKRDFLTGALDWSAGTVKALLVDSGYTADLANHVYLSSVPASARVTAGVAVGNRAVSGGDAQGADVVFTAVSGNTVTGVVVYEDTGNENTSRLIVWVDTANGLPLAPNGNDVTVAWAGGVVFRI